MSSKYSHLRLSFNPEPAKMRRYRELLSTIFILSQYEERVLSALLAAEEPLCAHQLFHTCGVPRTKVYGVLKKLTRMGLTKSSIITEDEVEKPVIWEYWPEHKQNQYLAEHLVNITRYTPRRETIEARIHEVTEATSSLTDTWAQLTQEARA